MYCNNLQEQQQGVDPRKRRFIPKPRSRSCSQEGGGPGGEDGGAGNIDLDISSSQVHRFHRERNSLDSAADYQQKSDEPEIQNKW